MDQELRLRIVLEHPPAGVDFGLQSGRGNNYQTIQKQRSDGKDLSFEFTVRVKTGGAPNFLGLMAQGPSSQRFVYLDIGTCAGQMGAAWSRRLKVPLTGITNEMIEQVLSDAGLIMETHVPGTGKDGGPTCGTVKPFTGWQVVQR